METHGLLGIINSLIGLMLNSIELKVTKVPDHPDRHKRNRDKK